MLRWIEQYRQCIRSDADVKLDVSGVLYGCTSINAHMSLHMKISVLFSLGVMDVCK